MPNPYFSNLTDFLYVNRTKDGRSEGDYSVVKNFFKRARLRDDIFQDLTFFTKYTVEGDDRPDNVANTVYDDPTLDWVVLLSNNIVNVQSECHCHKQILIHMLLKNMVMKHYTQVFIIMNLEK